MDRNKAIESVNEIKELMERSSKFVSLSGMTAVLAGVYALAGAYVAGQLLRSEDNREGLIMVASLVLIVSVVTACILSWYKAKKMRQKLFSKLTCRIAWNFSLPLLTGGLFCIALLLREHYGLVSSVMLLSSIISFFHTVNKTTFHIKYGIRRNQLSRTLNHAPQKNSLQYPNKETLENFLKST